jgi:Mor family transcriptional regulator
MIIKFDQADIERLYNKTHIVIEGENIGCWETSYCIDTNGYPRFSIKQINLSAHRFMYQVHHPDEDISDKSICHTCDNTKCVNPDHLWSGSHQSNMKDMVSKGRNNKGSGVNLSKLNEDQVNNILKDIINGKFSWVTDISKTYQISNSVIWQILGGRIWKHVTKNYDLKRIKDMIITDCKGTKNFNSQFTEKDIHDIRKRVNGGESQRKVAKDYDVHQTTISEIIRGKTYKSVI